MSVYREYNPSKSREPLKRFSQNFVLHIFQAREDDVDRSHSCKKLGSRSVCLSVHEHNYRKYREPL